MDRDNATPQTVNGTPYTIFPHPRPLLPMRSIVNRPHQYGNKPRPPTRPRPDGPIPVSKSRRQRGEKPRPPTRPRPNGPTPASNHLRWRRLVFPVGLPQQRASKLRSPTRPDEPRRVSSHLRKRGEKPLCLQAQE